MTKTETGNNSGLLLAMFIVVLNLGCANDDPPATPIDPAYFEAFTIQNPNLEFLYDTTSNLIYVFTTDDGQAVSYDYKNYQLTEKTRMPKIESFELAAGRHQGQPEVYLGIRKFIHIYDGITLTLKDSIRLFDDGDSRVITSLEWESPNLIFASSNSHELGSYAINRDSKAITGNSSCCGGARLRSYHNNFSNLIEVINVPYGTPIVIDKYTESGEFVDSYAQFTPQKEISVWMIKTHDDAEYFINEDEGNIFSKDSIKFLGSISGINFTDQYNDVVVHDHGNMILALTTGRALKIYSYPSLQITKNMMLPAIPLRGFIDEGQLIIIYMKESTVGFGLTIFLSKIDL